VTEEFSVPEVEEFTEKLCDVAFELENFKNHLREAEESLRKLLEKWGIEGE